MTNAPLQVLRWCLHTRGMRSLGRRFLSPAFLIPKYPNYGQLSEKFTEQAGEIRIVGFPKSGNVWLTSLIATCLGVDVNAAKGACRVTHTHQKMKNEDLFNKQLLRGAVLIRDLRDIIVSLYHFTKTDHFKNAIGRHFIFDDIETMYTDFFLPYYVNRIQMLETLPDEYVQLGWPVIRYERFCDAPEQELKRLFQVWNIQVTEHAILNSIKQNSLNAMRTGKGKTTEEVQSTHFRKGGYGNYKKEIPAHILADIEYRFGDYLRRWGYVLEGEGYLKQNSFARNNNKL